jgi:hypothetical protein
LGGGEREVAEALKQGDIKEKFREV